jgi:N-acetylneuraminic acid mutarotase
MLNLIQGAVFPQLRLGRLAQRHLARFHSQLEELEPRVVLATFAVNAELHISHLDNQGDAPGGAHEVVFFESSVGDYQALRQGLGAGTDAVVLDQGGDGLREMAAFLASRHDLVAVGVVAHGAPGVVELGNATLNEQNVGSYTNELGAVGSALGRGGELDLWSCNVAAGKAGESLLRELASATDAGVAAAIHMVGSAALGGVWQLDVQIAGARGLMPFSTASLGAFRELLGTWSPAASMATARGDHTATLLSDGQLLVTGGEGNGNSSLFPSSELYDPVSNTWSAAGSMAIARDGATATLLGNGKVLVAGGAHGTYLASAELYDPVSNTWSPAGSMATARDTATATLLGNGKVLVTGGIGAAGFLSSAELYDPVSNRWTSAGNMPDARHNHTATLLDSGKVLVVGGGNGANYLSSAALYDPITNSWSAVGSTATGRYHHTATLLSSGKVLVTGGFDANSANLKGLSSAEVYDPTNSSWSTVASMGTGRAEHAATLLSSGKVLVTGGSSALSDLSSAELYDPTTNTWSSEGDMATARFYHTATLLSNGEVLVAGGFSFNAVSTLSSCELYDPGPSFVVDGFPSTIAAGVAGTFTVTAKNGDGTTNTGYAGTIHFTSSDPNAILPGDYMFTAADHGAHTFSATFNSAGTQSLTATGTASGDIAGFESGINIWDPAMPDPSRSTISVAPATIFSGGSATVTLTARNQAGNLVTTGGLPFSFGLGAGASSGTFSNLTDNHNGTYSSTFTGMTSFIASTFTITATLNGQPITSPLPTITVKPAVPAAQLAVTSLSSTSLKAGGVVTFTVTAEDSTGAPVPSYTGTVQLNSTDAHAVIGGSGLPSSYTFVPSDNGVHTFTVMLGTAGSQTISVTDQANNSLIATTSPITVSAGPFSQFAVSVPGGNTFPAGSPFLVTAQASDAFGNPVTNYSGPSTVIVSASSPDPQSNLPITGTLNNSGFGFFLANLKTAGSYTLSATAGTFSNTSSTITVIPAEPSYFTVTAPAAATTGSPFNVTVTAYDHFDNIATNYMGAVKLTGTEPAANLGSYTFTTGAGKDNGVHTFPVTLQTAGNQTITVTDTNSTNPTITGTSTAITTRGLTVTGFTPTATGFTVNFSKPFTAADVNLYGGSQASPLQDVTLVGASSGPVTGSFVVDPSGTSATFKASSIFLSTFFQSSVLPGDTWTVTLASGTGSNAHGFFDSLNAPLDGGNNAGQANYTTTFTTANSSKEALSIPDFARGPDGANIIKVPNDSAKGIPVTLANVPAASGVTDLVFTLTYNPTLLTPTGAGTGDSSGTGSTFTMGTPANVDATHSTVTFTWHNATAQSGTVVLGDILASVPNSAASEYKAKEILGLTQIKVNGTDFTGVWANGLHVNAYFGDVTGDGKISGLDVATAGVVAGGDSLGLAAFKLVDPAVIGDIAGDASIDATAVSDLAALTSNLPTTQIPAIPVGLTITPGGPDPTLNLAGGNGIVSVLLDHPHPAGSTGMEEAVLALTYDPKVLSVSSSDITLGSIPGLTSGWHLVSVVDQATGQIGIDLYSTTPITATQAGSLVNIAFYVVPGTAVPDTAMQLVSAVTPNGRSFSTEVADDQGQYFLSPGIDRLVVTTRSSLASQPSSGGAGKAIFARSQILLDSLSKHAEEAEGNSPPPFSETNDVLAQTFQIGAPPLLNTLLLQNSPRQLAADRLFLALARLKDTDVVSATGLDGQQAPDPMAMDTVFAQMD